MYSLINDSTLPSFTSDTNLGTNEEKEEVTCLPTEDLSSDTYSGTNCGYGMKAPIEDSRRIVFIDLYDLNLYSNGCNRLKESLDEAAQNINPSTEE